MRLVARCKHCGESRQWDKLPDGSIVPTEADGPCGRLRYPYVCSANDCTVPLASAICEPLIQTAGERMIGDLARSAGKRTMRIGHGGGKRR